METKEKTLDTQLLEFQKNVTVIKKDAKNPHFKNTYATLTQILSEVKPLLSELGLVLTQPITNNEVMTTISFGNKCFNSSIPLPTNLSPQQLGSAITYFRRYTLASLLALEIDDDDANEASKQPVKEVAKTLPSTTATELPPLDDTNYKKVIELIKKKEFARVKKAIEIHSLLVEQKNDLIDNLTGNIDLLKLLQTK